jgi:hypothetical protein
MDPLSFLKSIIKTEQSSQLEPLKLREGQIINGKVIRFLPNDMSVVQIGSQKLIAKLEASLEANQQYWFEVQTDLGKVHLKLLKGNTKQIPKEAVEDPRSLNKAQDGGIEQFYSQIPIQLEQEKTEISIQWNGRKKENGKIDPDNCRILFFVELKNMGEIFVDIRFQNRNVKISMLNKKQGLERIAQPLILLLQDNLNRLNFNLTSFSVDLPPSEKSMKSFLKKPPTNGVFEHYQGTGVDVRI